MCTFSDEGDLCTELHPGFECVLHAAMSVETDLIGAYTSDAVAVLAVHDAGTSKAGIDLDTELVGDGAQPSCELREGGDVVAVVGHLGWVWNRNGVFLGEKSHGGGRGGLFEGMVVPRGPVRKELIESTGLDDSARKDM